MSIAHLSGGSPIWLNRGGNPVSERAAVQRQSNPSADAPGHSAKSGAPVRRSPLVAAMMEAMQSLLPASPAAATTASPATAAATATVAPAGASAATAAPSSAPLDLKQVAYAFAHELYSALRGAGAGDDSGPTRSGRPGNPGDQGNHGHHGHHGVSNKAYGDLAQRLAALTQSLATAATAPAVPAAATTSAGAVPSGAAATTTTATAAGPAASPLLSAFKNLLSALAPSTAPNASGTDSDSAKLTAFLHQMAQSLGLGGGEAASSMPASGSLLNVTA